VHKVKLSLVPLPKSALGAAGKSLALTHDSGVVSNAAAAGNSTSGTASMFKTLGRVSGYELQYGDPFSGATGVTAISTGVEQYKTAAGAKKGLAFWRKDDAKIPSLAQYGVTLTLKTLKAPALGATRGFGLGTTYTITGVTPFSLVDERVADGRFVLQVVAAADSLSTASSSASKLMRALDHRLRLAETGHLRGKPVKLLGPPTAGPPPGGPDLATLALTPADFGGQATVSSQKYEVPSTPSLSEYQLEMAPAGSYADLFQIIDWFPTANDATVLARVSAAAFATTLTSAFPGATAQFTPIDLSSVGDNAFGGVVQVTTTGQPTIYISAVVLSAGQALDLVFTGSLALPQNSDVLNLAQLAAARLNAGLAG
jgi:hypothetical protein